MYDAAAIELTEIQSPPQKTPAVALTNWGELRAYSLIPSQGKLDEAMT